MAGNFKMVGTDDDELFPPRVEERLSRDFAPLIGGKVPTSNLPDYPNSPGFEEAVAAVITESIVDNGNGTLTLTLSSLYVDNGDGTLTIGA